MLRTLEGGLGRKHQAEPDDKLACLTALERKVLWLSTWMIHNANHLRPNRDGLKVGGHQASSASVATLMTALYFDVLRPQDRVAVKPHASPVFHAIQYLLGHQTRDKLERFRGFGGAQSYPSRTKDGDTVDFSTGSVGLGVGMTLFASLAQDYLRLKRLVPTDDPPGRMIALAGDAELDEGNIFEALLEGWKHDVRNLWWVIDYNRQSLDAVVSDRLFGRIDAMFEMMGWRVVTLKYGRLLEAAFARPDGHHLREWIDACPNSLYSALVYKGGEGWREHLHRDLNRYPGIRAILDDHDDAALQRLMTNLAGHDMDSVLAAFHAVEDDRPTCFIAYTIKGYGLPFAGHKDNHAGLMNLDQMASFRRSMAVPDGAEWEPFAGLDLPPERLAEFLEGVPLAGSRPRRHDAAAVAVPPSLPVPRGARLSTQEAFGRLLGDIAASDGALAERIVTTSPDVTVSTNLGPWVNRRGIFDRAERADTFREEKVVSAQRWAMSPQGQHIELGIAESNLFLQLAALGLAGTALRHAPAADRHALRPVHQARAGCAELCLLPGCAIYPGGDPFGHHLGARRRRAPVGRRAADRARPAGAHELRAGLCRRAGDLAALGVRGDPAGDRRIGLFPAVDPADRPAPANDRPGPRRGDRRRRLLAA